MLGFLSFVASQWKRLPVTQPPADVKDRTYVITGANTGLGYECAKHLINFGTGRVILAVRTVSKGEAALNQIRKDTGRTGAGEVWQLDLESFDSVEQFAKRLETLDRLDVLVENAGIARIRYFEIEGVESTLMINVLSTILLALRALPKLRETAVKFGTKSNLAIVASNTALYPDVAGMFDGVHGNLFETLSRPETMDEHRYPFSKQLAILATRNLASLLPLSDNKVIINVVNPGFCKSELAREANGVQRVMMNIMKLLLARTTEQGSRTLLNAAFSGPDSHGCYMSSCKPRDDMIPEWLMGKTGAEKQQRVWGDLLAELQAKGHPVNTLELFKKP
ncbi:putative short-chain dehydrogenase [Thozetella sp. PMI_491]|nr:putative short-chain dehydrogenase [Thozetella sp. PMI_491]